MSPVNVAVLASGRGSNLQSLLDAFAHADAPARVALVVSNTEAAGALARARAAKVATLVTRKDGQDAAGLLAAFHEQGIQVIVLAGWLRKLPAELVRAFPRRIVNVHPALLPAFGGPGMYGEHVHEAVLASGARVSGATVHLVDEEYDRGAVLAQWPVPVHAHDSVEHLAARVLAAEHRLLPRVVADVCRRVAAGADAVPLAVAAEHFGSALRPQIELSDPVIQPPRPPSPPPRSARAGRRAAR